MHKNNTNAAVNQLTPCVNLSSEVTLRQILKERITLDFTDSVTTRPRCRKLNYYREACAE